MAGIRLHKPIAIVVLAAITPLLLITLLHLDDLVSRDLSWNFGLLFLVGIVYTHFFEYGYHRVVMHGGIKHFALIKKKHLEHHTIFNGDHFTTQKESDLKQIAPQWYLFPAAFLVHYFVIQAFLPSQLLLAFFGGVVLHYVVFEVSHWFGHVEDNFFDRIISYIPLLNWIRDYQNRHHRLHHECPDADFNFNPPFLGDVLYGTFAVPPKSHDPFACREAGGHLALYPTR